MAAHQNYSLVQVMPVTPTPPPNFPMIPQLYLCAECGSAVGDMPKHDDWHERVEKAAAMKTGKIL